MSATPKNLRVFASMLEGVNEAIATLDKIKSMEQLETEHRARIAALKADADALQQTAAELGAEVDEASKNRDRLIADGHAEAEEIVAAAGADAKRILAQANDELHKAKGTALQLVADAKAVAEREEARAAAAVAQREEAQATLAELQAAISKITGG